VPDLTLSAPVPFSRHLPPQATAQAAREMAESGLVDDILIWDQITWFFPPSLWNAENLPAGFIEAMPDPDSFPDAFATAAYVLGQVPGIGVTISTESVRRGPLELMQTMLTLADMTNKRAIFQIGGGEVKQLRPSKWKRNGLAQLEDKLDIFHTYMKADGPIDFEGNVSKLDKAWIGGARSNRPSMWALGGGPKLIDIACAKADGFSTVAPFAWPTPEKAAEEIRTMRERVEAGGRDPDEFEFGVWFVAIIHEDPAQIERVIANELIRWQTAIFGRLNMSDWDAEGIEPPMPRDWHYAANLEPMKWGRDETYEVLDRVTDEMVRKSWIIGTPQEVAAELKAYQDAGVSWIHLSDLLPLAIDVSEGETPMDRTYEVFKIVRGSKAPG
jgi:phthiodiolone/phenolphthiodiolone dimycocerosates ketoreductase